MMRRPARGQAVTEVALGLLLIIPILLGAIYLAEAAIFRLEATEAATEPLWDATAYQHNSYTGTFNRTPSAVAAANALAQSRQVARAMVFTQTSVPSVRCTAGTGMGVSIGPTASVYDDNNGLSCTSAMTVDPKGMTRFFLDNGQGALFKEPLARFEKNFDFTQNEANVPFKMAIGDWGLTNQNGEDEECRLTMDSCANQGFFDFSKRIYEAHRTGGGTQSKAFLQLVEGVVIAVPSDLGRVTEFQMSYRGEPGFTESVPVSEGDSPWRTSPSLDAWGASYGARSSKYLGLP